MAVAVGKTYKTSSGHTVAITRDVGDLVDDYPFYGEIRDAEGKVERIAYFTPLGRYKRSGKSQFDLVGEVECNA